MSEKATINKIVLLNENNNNNKTDAETVSFFDQNIDGGIFERTESSCCSCNTTSSIPKSNSLGYNKRDDNQTRAEFCDIPLHEFLKLECNANTCPFGGKCINATTIGELKSLRMKTWGGLMEQAPTAKQRKNFIYDILQASFNKAENKFQFIAGGSPGNYHLVCEAAYLILLGISKSRNASDCSFQWKTAKRRVLGLEKETIPLKLHKQEKLDSAVTYIDHVTTKLADTSPFPGQDKTLIIPYYDVQSFYNDYTRHQVLVNAEAETVSVSTFRRAFESQTNIKLLGSKGSFHTCEICNNALDLLHDESKFLCCTTLYN